MVIEPIFDVDALQVVAKLDAFHRWFSGDTTVPGQSATAIALPAVLVWALSHSQCFGQRFLADVDVDADGTLHCFQECGDVFGGYIDEWRPGNENPEVRFRFLGTEAHQPPRRLADLVIGAYFETIAFEAEELSDGKVEYPSDDHLVWYGDYLYLDEPVRVWVDGELLVLLVPPVSDVPMSLRRTRSALARVRAVTIDIPERTRVQINVGEPVTVSAFRRHEPASESASLAWRDIRQFAADGTGWERDGVATVPWSRVAPYWQEITAHLDEPAPGSTTGRMLVYFDDGSRATELETANLKALDELRSLLASASRRT